MRAYRPLWRMRGHDYRSRTTTMPYLPSRNCGNPSCGFSFCRLVVVRGVCGHHLNKSKYRHRSCVNLQEITMQLEPFYYRTDSNLPHNPPCTWSHFTTHSNMHLEPFYYTLKHALGAILLHTPTCTWSHFTTHSNMHLEPFYYTLQYALGAILLHTPICTWSHFTTELIQIYHTVN
jgi:hypothetical protein